MPNKVVVVTGGFGSLGRAVAQRLLNAGARVAALDKAQPPAAGLVGATALGGVDLADPANAVSAFEHIVAETGRIDAVVNIAGAFRWETLEHGSLDTWDLLYQINLRTAVSACKAAIPHLLRQETGRIVNIGAASSIKAGASTGAYAASKAGVAKLTESMAEEFKDRGITVNAVLPGIIDTPPNRAEMPDADFSRWVRPAEIAEVIAFLLSDEAQPITGALIPVTGRL